VEIPLSTSRRKGRSRSHVNRSKRAASSEFNIEKFSKLKKRVSEIEFPILDLKNHRIHLSGLKNLWYESEVLGNKGEPVSLEIAKKFWRRTVDAIKKLDRDTRLEKMKKKNQQK